MSYIFSLVKCHMFAAIIWYQNIDRCFAFNIVNAIHNVYVGILSFCWFVITNKACCKACDGVTFHFDGYNAIMYGRYLKHWFINSYCHILGICEKSVILLYVTILLFCPKHMIVKISFVHQCQNYLSIWSSVTNDEIICELEISYPEMKCCHV